MGRVARPGTADGVVVAVSVPPPGLVPMATVMLAVDPVAVLPNASCTATCTAGAIATPATASLGCPETATRDRSSALPGNRAEVGARPGVKAAASGEPAPL